jgi:hypothetical protein
MKTFIYIFIITIILFSAGCSEKPKEAKYISEYDHQRYITFYSDGTAFYHTGGVENYNGTWREVEGEHEPERTVFLTDGSSLVFRMLSDDMIGLKVEVRDDNGGIVRYYNAEVLKDG